MTDAKMLEREVEQHLVDQVNRFGGEVRKLKWIGRRGAPDRVLFLRGKVVWVELKRPKGGRVSALQQQEMDALNRHGQRVRLVNTKAGVDKLLSELMA